MARNHARILTAIWKDSDWLTLSPLAQRAYMLLLSQPRLSMCGAIDYTPGRWATLGAGDTEADLRRSIDELDARAFVLVADDTQELLLRSFVRHDGILDSPNLVQAMWKAWESVYSDTLRRAVVHELPDLAFTTGFGAEKGRAKEYEPPEKALHMRLEPFDEPSPKGSEKGSPTPVPVPGARSCSGRVSSSRGTAGEPAPIEDDDDPRIGQALDMLARLDLSARQQAKPDQPVGDVDRWLDAARRRRVNLDGQAILEHAKANPDWTVEQLAEATLRGDGPTAASSPLDATAAAAAAMRERGARLLAGDVCDDCHDVPGLGQVETDAGVVPCPTCRPDDHRIATGGTAA